MQMNLEDLKNTIGTIDIYLLDQILKGRYTENYRILDAGCGKGRNLKWFYHNNFSVYGIDMNTDNIDIVKEIYESQKEHFSVQSVDALTFEDKKFNHVICNAVLHFAQNELHFKKMFSELVRVLKPNGTLFIRTATIDSLTDKVEFINDGVYKLPDTTKRFLLTRKLLSSILTELNLELIEPYKYINVDNLRCMATIVLRKL